MLRDLNFSKNFFVFMHSSHFPSISALCRYLPFVFCFSPQHFPKQNAHTRTHTLPCVLCMCTSLPRDGGSHTGMRQHSAPARICHISPGLCLILLFNCSCYFFLPAPLWIALHFAARNLMSLARDCSEQCMLIPVLTYKRWENVCSPECTSLCAQGKMRHLKGICIPVYTPL